MSQREYIGRLTPEAPLELTYANAQYPAKFADVRGFTMFSVTIPAALNGRTVTPYFASDAAGTGKKIPKYFKSDGTYAVMPGLEVATDDIIVFQADTAAAWFFGLYVDQAVTVLAAAPVEIRPKG